jgi:hypothetical protein
MRGVVYAVPPSFAAKVGSLRQNNGFYRACLLKSFSSQFRRAGLIKKKHRFSATTDSLKLSLNTVFIITFYTIGIYINLSPENCPAQAAQRLVDFALLPTISQQRKSCTLRVSNTHSKRSSPYVAQRKLRFSYYGSNIQKIQ